MEGVPNGVTLMINYVRVVEGANVKVALEEIGLEVGEFVTVAKGMAMAVMVPPMLSTFL